MKRSCALNHTHGALGSSECVLVGTGSLVFLVSISGDCVFLEGLLFTHLERGLLCNDLASTLNFSVA